MQPHTGSAGLVQLANPVVPCLIRLPGLPGCSHSEIKKAQHPGKSIAPLRSKNYSFDLPAAFAFFHRAFAASDLAFLRAGEICLLGFASGLGVWWVPFPDPFVFAHLAFCPRESAFFQAAVIFLLGFSWLTVAGAVVIGASPLFAAHLAFCARESAFLQAAVIFLFFLPGSAAGPGALGVETSPPRIALS